MRKNKWAVGKILTFFILILFSVVCLYPIVWMFLNSFKTNDELFTNPWGFPAVLHFENYTRAIVNGNIGISFLNSCIITFFAVFIAVLLSCMVSYGLERLIWKGAGKTKGLFLVGMSIPAYAAIVPLFSMFHQMHILDTYLAVIVAHVVFALPMSIFILTGFFSTIPGELEEAAIMDGCSLYGCFFRIIMPVAKSSTVTVAVIDFINIWNDLLFPQIFLSSDKKMPLPVSLTVFADLDSVDYSGMTAAVVFTVIPTIIVYIILHDKIMEGMTAGAVKG